VGQQQPNGLFDIPMIFGQQATQQQIYPSMQQLMQLIIPQVNT